MWTLRALEPGQQVQASHNDVRLDTSTMQMPDLAQGWDVGEGLGSPEWVHLTDAVFASAARLGSAQMLNRWCLGQPAEWRLLCPEEQKRSRNFQY
jgi:hypothetical protein